MTVVPRDKFSRGMTAPQIFARDAHAPVGLRASRVENLVIMCAQISQRKMLAEFDVTVKTESWIRRDFFIDFGYALDLWVIGRDAAAHETVRRRQTVEHVNLDDHAGLFEQMIRRVERRGTRTDNRDAHWIGFIADQCHDT